MSEQLERGPYFLSHMLLREEVLRRGQLWRTFQNEYGMHQLIWRLFSDGSPQPRPFVYRVDHGSRGPFREAVAEVYAVSTSEPVDQEGYWELHTRVYQPQLRAGELLQFSLRANPVVSLPRVGAASERRRGVRHDAIFHALRQEKRRPISEQRLRADVVHSAAQEWLNKRAGQNGFEVITDTLRVDAYLQHWLMRPKTQEQKICFSTVDFQGVLKVTEPQSFLSSLLDGLGHTKAFGCGLLLVKRV
ncbi:MAG: type I-E CRISPR-associated protein Cas6/Cse3/CasE [Myxococcota bacterium]